MVDNEEHQYSLLNAPIMGHKSEKYHNRDHSERLGYKTALDMASTSILSNINTNSVSKSLSLWLWTNQEVMSVSYLSIITHKTEWVMAADNLQYVVS
jgi:hypothetical protein